MVVNPLCNEPYENEGRSRVVKFLRKIPPVAIMTSLYTYIRAIHQPSRSTKDARWIIKFLVAGNGSRYGFSVAIRREGGSRRELVQQRESSTPGKGGKRRRMRSVLMLDQVQ